MFISPHSLKYVGNGLCAVPLRCNYNPCANKTEPPPEMSFRANGSEPRNLPEWQVLSCVGSLSHVVDSSTPLAVGMTQWGACLGLSETVPSFRVRNGTQAVPYGFAGWGTFQPGILRSDGTALYVIKTTNAKVKRPSPKKLSIVNWNITVNCFPSLSVVYFLTL